MFSRRKLVMQPYTFVYSLSVDEEVLVSKLEHTHPFLFKFMPFNYVLVEAERECIFYINQTVDHVLHVPKGGGVVEADHINLWSWKLVNLYDGDNKVYVSVQKE